MITNSSGNAVIVDVLFTFIVPPICFVSLLTNLVNVYVFIKMRHLNIIYKFLLCKSASNTIYLCICMFIFVAKCGRFCSFDNSYMAKAYELYLFTYVASVLGFVDLLIEIFILLQRFFLLKNKPFLEKKNVFIVIVPLLMFATILYLPTIFLLKISRLSSDFGFDIYEIKPVQKNLYEIMVILLNGVFRISLMLILIILLNMVGFFIFKHRLAKRNQDPHLTKTNKDEIGFQQHTFEAEKYSHFRNQRFDALKNFNRMIIFQTLLYLFGNLPFIVTMIILSLTGGRESPFLIPLVFMINICLFTSLGFNIILYTSFNRVFKRTCMRLGSSFRHLRKI